MYYGYYVPVYGKRQPTPPAPAKPFADQTQFLQMLLRAIYDERVAQRLYRVLFDRAERPFQKRQIKHALDDESKHERMLTDMYVSITGEQPQVPQAGPVEVADFQTSLRGAFEDELEAAEHYRTMRRLTHVPYFRDQLFEIMTDEMEHATRFAYLRAEL